ncbi:MAG: hypothetical protein IJZ62_02835, partial [Clostridia bacterium]|nr:hypothetical protein [Clostridia bacterium]
MKNKKSIFFRIVCLLMIFCTSFVFVGCMGMDPDELKEYESELAGGDYDPFDEDSLDFTMYGTKVLYRPEGYDYNAGSGGTEENPNDYYGQYAWVILNDLFNIYGIVLDTDEEDPYESRLEAFDSDKSNLPYLYDSIRYQVDTVGQVTNQVNEDGTDTGTEVNYTIVGADLSSKWNWSFNYVWPNVEGSLMDTAYKILDNHLYNINSETMNDAKSAIISHYTDATKNIGDKYQSIYLGTTSQTDYDNYSPYVKALEYAIYSYALDLEPAQVQITYASTGDVPYSVKIGNVAVDNALANIKQLFNQAGSYVGLTTRQAEKLKVWILNNVIGSSAQDDFTTYANVTEVVGDDGKTVVGYEFGTGTTVNLGRDYENAVDRIVEGVCSQVTIGNADGDGDGKIQDNFLASEI